MSATKWKTLPFERAVHSRGSGGLGLPTKQWLPSGQFPVIGQGAEEIEGWTDRKDLLLTPAPAVVLYGGHTRRAKHVSQPFVPGPNVKILQPDPAVDSKFLYYFLTQLPVESKGYADHFPLVRKCQVPIPSLPEQQRIVGVLDEAFDGLATAKANAEKNLQNARALFESHLQSVFTQRGPGWVEKPFSELCDVKHGYAFEGEFFSNAGQYVLLTPGNFYEKGGYRDRGEKQKYYTGEIPKGFVLSKGDLLVAMTEQAAGLLGSPIIVPESGNFLHNQRLGLVTKKPEVPWMNEFFFHAFNTPEVRNEIHASASGVKVRHTSPAKIGAVVVAFPTSLSEQAKIVSNLAALATEVQRLAAIYEQKLAALEALKKSLLHQAFSGAL
jgi:type I restriction enzyme S subunit